MPEAHFAALLLLALSFEATKARSFQAAAWRQLSFSLEAPRLMFLINLQINAERAFACGLCMFWKRKGDFHLSAAASNCQPFLTVPPRVKVDLKAPPVHPISNVPALSSSAPVRATPRTLPALTTVPALLSTTTTTSPLPTAPPIERCAPLTGARSWKACRLSQLQCSQKLVSFQTDFNECCRAAQD